MAFTVLRPVPLAFLVAIVGMSRATIGQQQLTQRVSVSTRGIPANWDCQSSQISGDGRCVGFHSTADNLRGGGTVDDLPACWPDCLTHVYVRDLVRGRTECMSVAGDGSLGNGSSFFDAIDAVGRCVVFDSGASNLVAGDMNASWDVFVRDRQTGTTERVSVRSDGTEGNADSFAAAISGDGRFVEFMSDASNLVANDTNGVQDVFVHDRLTGTTERVSVSSAGAEGDSYSYPGTISGDGRFAAFTSQATNLVPGDTNGTPDVFVRDRVAGVTERVDLDSSGSEANGVSEAPVLTPDGRFVAFTSLATNLVPADTNATYDVFVRDRQSGTTERMSVAGDGTEANAQCYWGHAISADGRFVAFMTEASNLVPGDTNGLNDVFVHDRLTGATERVSVATDGTQSFGGSSYPSISGEGRFVAFSSPDYDLVENDVNNSWDVFVHDRAATGFTSVCDPAAAGVIACPCANPPSGSARGCDNSSGTGGATLSASGVAYLSLDSLVFTTTGERATATSVLLQGTTAVPGGVVYGQGVRCLGGAMKRLFTKNAAGGSITAPDFGSGDPTVSVRSTAKGSPIAAGQSRWYFVFYRDPTVLGGCPATSTFNATQTGRVDWSL